MSQRLNEIIKNLAKKMKRHPRTVLTWYDDAGGLFLDKEQILIKVDGFAASRSKYPWCSYKDFGFKAVTATVSDVYAKGCRPYIYAVSIGVTPDKVDLIEDIIRGVEEAVDLYGGYIENIDTNVGMDLWIDVFALALCKYLPIPRRILVGDAVVLVNKVGLTSIAYNEYIKGKTPRDVDVLNTSCKPTVSLNLVNAIDVIRPAIVGSIDISDTVYESLEHISSLNNAGIYINATASELLHPKAVCYAYEEGIDMRSMFLFANEEYTPILVIDEAYIDYVIGNLRYYGFDVQIIGTGTSLKEVRWRGEEVKKFMWSYELGKVVEI
ncbi:MAG: AIR synthase related protein [Ignisphaera sp.]|uniref:PurM-like N-terminal domain-containing protein n=1 Tax=Ignisphaera aggregans TaxID=334771 RepID=A0A7C4JJM5_9CREN